MLLPRGSLCTPSAAVPWCSPTGAPHSIVSINGASQPCPPRCHCLLSPPGVPGLGGEGSSRPPGVRGLLFPSPRAGLVLPPRELQLPPLGTARPGWGWGCRGGGWGEWRRAPRVRAGGGCAHCVQTPPERRPPLRWTRVGWPLPDPGMEVRGVPPRDRRTPYPTLSRRTRGPILPWVGGGSARPHGPP